MAVNKNKHGVWYFILWLPTGEYDERGNEILKQIKRESKKWLKRDAKKAERQFLNEYSPTNMKDKTFNDVFEEFASVKKKRLKRNSYNDLVSVYQNHIKDKIGNIRFNKITVSTIENCLEQLLDSKKEDGTTYQNATIQRIQTHLFSILRFGIITRGYHDNTRLLGVEKVKIDEIPKERTIIELEGFKRLIEPIEDITIQIIFYIFYFTGMRKGEVLGLTFNDVDTEKKIININKQLDTKTREITTPKTKRSIRKIIIPEVLNNKIIEYLDYLQDYKISKSDTFLVAYTSPTELDRIKTRAFKESGVEQISWHEFRHSHCSLLINYGFSEFEVADRLGDTVEMVHKIYGHLFNSRKQAMIESLNDKLKIDF